jgi:hypothetical protein
VSTVNKGGRSQGATGDIKKRTLVLKATMQNPSRAPNVRLRDDLNTTASS